MGIRSQVGLAIKSDLHKRIRENATQSLLQLLDDSDETSHYTDGSFYHWDWVKWYKDDHKDIIELYKFLEGNEEDYLLLELCEMDSPPEWEGRWDTNPFNLGYTRSMTYDL